MVDILFIISLLIFAYSAFWLVVFLVIKRRTKKPIATFDLRKTERSTAEFEAAVGPAEIGTIGVGLIAPPKAALEAERRLMINEITERMFKVDVVESYPKSIRCGHDAAIELDFIPSGLGEEVEVKHTEERKVAINQIVFTSDRDKVDMKIKLVSNFFKITPEEQTIELRKDMQFKRHLEYTIHAKCYELSLKGLALALKFFVYPWGAIRTVNIMGLVDGITVFSDTMDIRVFPDIVFMAIFIISLIAMLINPQSPISISISL